MDKNVGRVLQPGETDSVAGAKNNTTFSMIVFDPPTSNTIDEPITTSTVSRKKASYVGAPAIFSLELEAKHLRAAFGGYGCYLVGSALERPDWRDVDVVYILPDDEFVKLFPGAREMWGHDPRWLLLVTALSERLSRVTGLPVDFKFQPQTWANEHHSGPRSALGLTFIKEN